MIPYPANQIAFVHDVLYTLKRDYGAPADIYQILQTEVNAETGIRTQTRNRIVIDRAIMLPSVLNAAFKYSLSYIAANKNFTYGGTYEKRDRFIILDGLDLPDGTVLQNTDYIVLVEEKGPVRYEIKTVERFEMGFGYLLTVQETAGASPFQILEFSLTSKMNLKQRVNRA